MRLFVVWLKLKMKLDERAQRTPRFSSWERHLRVYASQYQRVASLASRAFAYWILR